MSADNLRLFFIDNDSKEEIKSKDELTNDKMIPLPDTGFILENEGAYSYRNFNFLIEKEGIYQFYENDKLIRQAYYYKGDIRRLFLNLYKSTEYNGESKPIDNIDVLSFRMGFNVENNLSFIHVMEVYMKYLKIPSRHISLYSPIVGNSVFDWMEIWDDKVKRWQLFWLDNAFDFGYTDYNNSYLDIFDSLVAQEIIATSSKQNIYREFVKDASYSERIESALLNPEEVSSLLCQLNVIPVLRENGNRILKVLLCDKYKDMLSSGCEKIKVVHDEELEYRVSFIDEKALRQRDYQPRIYVFPGSAVKTM